MEKKGLNFLVGLAGIWLIWKLYTIGILHRIGFLAINSAIGSDLVFNTFSDTYGSTPLAVFAALLIDAIAVFGSLLVIVSSGLWDLLLQAGVFLNDLGITLKAYLSGYKKEVKEVQTIEENKENPLEIILLEVKAIRDSQIKLEEDVKLLKGENNE